MADVRRVVRDGSAAGAWAGALSGAPSTVAALVRRGSPLEASRAAGAILLPAEARDARLLPAAALVHGTLSVGWGVALAATLPRRRTVAAGVAAGLVIAALDLGVVGRAFPRIRALPLGPQVADHVAFGVIAATVIERRRSLRALPRSSMLSPWRPPTDDPGR